MLLIRHAESEWNRQFGATRIDPGIADPVLTQEGRAAATVAADALVRSDISRIVASPYRRTIETACLLAERLQVSIGIDPLVRERCAFSCDQGSSPAKLARSWPGLDFAALEERWWGQRIESMESLSRRVRRFLARAQEQPDRDAVLVVTHWGFIRAATGAEVGNLTTTRLQFDTAP